MISANQNEVFTDFKIIYRKKNSVSETSQSIIFIEKTSNITKKNFLHQSKLNEISCLVHIFFFDTKFKF